MTDREHPAWTILGTLAGVAVVVAVVVGQATQIRQLRRLEAESGAARVRNERAVKRVFEALERYEPAIAKAKPEDAP